MTGEAAVPQVILCAACREIPAPSRSGDDVGQRFQT